MAKRIVDDTSLTQVADAIREKTSSSKKLIFPEGFTSAISSIDLAGTGITPTGTIQITENNKTFDVTTFANAEVNIQMEEAEEVKLTTIGITPRAEGWELVPEDGYTGFSKVTVSGDADLSPENIKKDINIFGVTGTYETVAPEVNVVLQPVTVTPTASGFTTTPETGCDGFSQVIVEGDSDLIPSNIKKDVNIFGITGTYETVAPEVNVVLQPVTVTPTASGFTTTPETGCDGFSQVIVEGDSDLIPSNIKKDINIFGVTGTYEGSVESGDSGENTVNSDIEVGSLSELHSWNKYYIAGNVYETKVDTLTISASQTGLDSHYEPLDYASDYDTSTGKIVLVNPTENVSFTSSNDAQVLLGKYIQTYALPSDYATTSSPTGKYYRIDSTATVKYSKSTYPTSGASLTASPAYRLTYTDSEEQLIGVVVSEDSTAYPQNGEQDGYRYVYNGTLDVSECDHTEVAQATPTITVSSSGLITATSTQTAGLVSAGTKTATKQIAHTNLTAGNIKKGVQIFNVTGSYEGTGSAGSSNAFTTKSGSTTTGTFDTGLSEIMAVMLYRNTVYTAGLVSTTVIPILSYASITGCSSYSQYIKTYVVSNTPNITDYCTINGGTVSWIDTSTANVFVENVSYVWRAVGYA